MNSRERFYETMRYGSPDRVPYFEEGIRDDVLRVWRHQGLQRKSEFEVLFRHDHREEIYPDLEPLPRLKQWPYLRKDLDRMRRRLNPEDLRRLTRKWPSRALDLIHREHAVMLHVQRGLFLSMGVEGWGRFTEVIELLVRDPLLVHDSLMIQGEFAARLADRVLRDVQVDAALFSEPVAEKRGPLISPKMYREIVLPSYDPLLSVLKRHGVETIVFVSWANPRLLIPAILDRGFNCLWAYEVESKAMDYQDLRREFGRDLRLIGGIDLDVLRQVKDAIRREVAEKVPPLLAEGGYIPMPALEKAGFEYRPPIQTRHTFATMMISSGEDIGWVQNMLGHSSLQMIFTRYYAWIPRSTRKDGLAFLNSVREKGEGGEPEKPRGGGKVIPLFSKSVTKTSQSTKRAHGD